MLSDSPNSSATNLLEAFEGPHSEAARRVSESAVQLKRRMSSFPSVVIEDFAPERFFKGILEQEMADVDITETHDYEKADAKDLLSRDPSFTNEFFGKWSSLQSYNAARQKYEAQFRKEIELLAENQPNALESVCFIRNMAYTSLWPPLHNRRELKRSERLFYPYSKKQKTRLHSLLWSRT